MEQSQLPEATEDGKLCRKVEHNETQDEPTKPMTNIAAVAPETAMRSFTQRHHMRLPRDAVGGSELEGLSPKQDCDVDLEKQLSKKSSNLLPVLTYRVGDPTGTEETRSQNPTTIRSSQLEHAATVAKSSALPPSPQESPIHRQESPCVPNFPELITIQTRERPNATPFVAGGNTSFMSLISKMSGLPQIVARNSELKTFTLAGHANPEVLGQELYVLIDTLNVDIIRLPQCRIDLPEITITRNVALYGCPGTDITVLHGPIRIKSVGVPITVIFAECSLFFTVDADSLSGPHRMFEVSGGAELEFQDCRLETECVNPPNESSEESTLLAVGHPTPKRTGIHMVGPMEETEGQKHTPTHGHAVSPAKLTVINSSFQYFTTAIAMGSNCIAIIEKSGFFKCQGTAIVAADPIKLSIDEVNIEGGNKSGLELYWTKAVAYDPTAGRDIKITNSYFCNLAECGMIISGEPTRQDLPQVEMLLSENRIVECKKDGIQMKGLRLATITMTSNHVESTQENCISIFRCQCDKFLLQRSTTRHAGGNGIFAVSSSLAIENCQCTYSKQSGISLSGNSIPKPEDDRPVQISIKNTKSQWNKLNGIMVLDLTNGVAMIDRCLVSGNQEYGLYLSCNEYFSSALLKPSVLAASSTPTTWTRRVGVVEGEITSNKSGIFLQHQNVDIDSVFIHGNVEYAIYIPVKASERCLVLLPGTVDKKCIQGTIGGAWGSASVGNQHKACGCSVCVVV